MPLYLFDELEAKLTEEERHAIYSALTESSGAAVSHDQLRLTVSALLKTIDAATRPKVHRESDEKKAAK